MAQVSAKDAAREYARTGKWQVWLDYMNMDYMKNFWMWVEAYS